MLTEEARSCQGSVYDGHVHDIRVAIIFDFDISQEIRIRTLSPGLQAQAFSLPHLLLNSGTIQPKRIQKK